MKKLAVIIAVLVLLGTSTALESKLCLPHEHKLIVDLDGEEYWMRTYAHDINHMTGIFWSVSAIEAESLEHAVLRILTPYSNTWTQMSEDSVQDIISGMAMASVLNQGGNVSESWTTTSYYGDPVTVYRIHNPARSFYFRMLDIWDFSFFLSDTYMAVWRVGENSYVIMISELDRETTSQIINTTRIV